MSCPQIQTTVTHSAVDRVIDTLSAKIIRIENGFDTATIVFSNSLGIGSFYYSDYVAAGDAIKVEIKDSSEAAWTTVFNGIIKIPLPSLSMNGNFLTVKCEGTGYGFGATVCAQEYGSTSRNPSLDTISEILTDATNGILPKWVNKILGSATDSGFAYTNTVENIAGTIPFISFPYKPNHKAIDDVCDILTALKAGAAGPHWIVTTGSKFLLTTIANHSAGIIAEGWNTYYGGSIVAATLVEGEDFIEHSFQKLSPEANYIIYYGNWSRPANCDAWTENNSGSWAATACAIADESGAGNYRVNSTSIKITPNHAVNPWAAAYPSTMNWSYDFSSFREYNVPTFNFWIKRGATADMDVRLCTNGGGTFDYTLQPGPLAAAATWYHINLPVGNYYKTAGSEIWTDSGGDWSDIDFVAFLGSAANGINVYVDGMHFGGAAVCRVAKNSTSITANKLKVKVITDNIGKDDSLVATDATGTMAQMAYAELLKAQTTPTIGTFQTSMIKDLLPGQLLHIHAQKRADGTFVIDMDMRVLELEHQISDQGFKTQVTVSSDVTNSSARSRYNDWNTIFQSVRPEFQDRQAASIKAGGMDIRITKLEKDYP